MTSELIPGRTVREQLADALAAAQPRCCEPRCSAPATVRVTYIGDGDRRVGVVGTDSNKKEREKE